MPAFGAMLPDRTVWELVAYIKSISQKPPPQFGRTTSLSPQSPDIEQVPAGQMQTATPWQYTEPMPKNGGKPGS
jgi:cytochrome c oxidase cbb3-type subunit 3